MAGKRGRPSKYTPAVADEICARLAAGETLRAICRDEHLPAAPTVIDWVNGNPEFSERYAHARQAGLDVIAEQMVEIADDTSEDANSRRVRVDTRKWLLSKLAPKRYGDRLELAGDKDAPLLPPTITVELVRPGGKTE